MLEQVLANIILNAAQAGATHLWVVAERTENGISIVLQITPGTDEAPRRVCRFTTRKEGSGLSWRRPAAGAVWAGRYQHQEPDRAGRSVGERRSRYIFT